MAPSQSATTLKTPRKRSAKKKSQNEHTRLNTLVEIAKEKKKQNNEVKNTEKSYTGQIRCCKDFLKQQIQKRRDDEIIVCELGIPTDELEKALGNPPNEYSAMVVEMFISEKCFVESCQIGTAEAIHSAFCHYWDHMDGDKYAGEYKINPETKEVTGNPARASCVVDIKKAVKNSNRNRGATREHAQAFTIEDIKTLMQYSQLQCPDSALESVKASTIDEVRHIFEHGFMRAFSSSAFTLWTRCFELLSLTYGELQLNCTGRAPYFTPHFKVRLQVRKGWQNSQGYDGPRTSNTYEIYQQDIQEIDMHSHLLRWITVLEDLLGRPLEPEDQLFPSISSNGIISPREEMSYDTFSKMLARFVSKANLTGSYTSHSYRRGGAQYRFIFAPTGRKWSLNRVRWWGGWAEGENVDTLMKYLFDSLQSFENGHGDALHPIHNGFSDSFAGEHLETAPVTASEVRELMRAVNDKVASIDAGLENKIDLFLNRLNSTLILSQPQPLIPAPPQSFSPVSSTPPSFPSQAFTFTSQVTASSEPVATFDVTATALSSQTEPKKKKDNRELPIQGVLIPNLKPGPQAWKSAIEQWEHGDSERGLTVPLKEWPTEWYTGQMRTFTGSKRRDRELIVLAYKSLGCDDRRFIEAYPEASRSIRSLLATLRTNPMFAKQRNSKKGTPEERRQAMKDRDNEDEENESGSE